MLPISHTVRKSLDYSFRYLLPIPFFKFRLILEEINFSNEKQNIDKITNMIFRDEKKLWGGDNFEEDLDIDVRGAF